MVHAVPPAQPPAQPPAGGNPPAAQNPAGGQAQPAPAAPARVSGKRVLVYSIVAILAILGGLLGGIALLGKNQPAPPAPPAASAGQPPAPPVAAPPAPQPVCTAYDRRMGNCGATPGAASATPPAPMPRPQAAPQTQRPTLASIPTRMQFIEAVCDGRIHTIDLPVNGLPIRTTPRCNFRLKVIYGTLRLQYTDGSSKDFINTTPVVNLKEVDRFEAVGPQTLTMKIVFCPPGKNFKPGTDECAP